MLLSQGSFETDRAYINGEWVDGGVSIADYQLTSYGEKAGVKGMAIPGFVDLQVNGHAGIDLLRVKDSSDIRKVSRTLFNSGVAAYLPTLITGPIENHLRVLSLIEQVRKEPLPGEAVIIGTHLEGPFISSKKPGVHPLKYILDPDIKLLGDFIRTAKISQVTLAPELPKAVEVIKFLVDSGVVVSLGHSDADTKQANDGFNAGAVTVTHLWNAMRKQSENQPGLAQVALERDDVIIQLIIDGIHLDKQLVIDSVKQCSNRFIVTVDAVSAAGLGDGKFQLGEVDIEVKNNRASRSDGTLAGGVGSLSKSLSLMWEYGVSLENAIDSVTSRGADLMGRPDLGRLTLGSPAQIWSF